MDHTDELEVLCQAANHLNESGGESGGEFWLQGEQKKNPLPTLESDNCNYEEIKIAKNVPTTTTTTTTSDKSVTDLVVI